MRFATIKGPRTENYFWRVVDEAGETYWLRDRQIFSGTPADGRSGELRYVTGSGNGLWYLTLFPLEDE